MRKVNAPTLSRILLALVAVLAVAGPGLVYAGVVSGYPAPRTAQILGPGSVSPNSINQYSLLVQFVGGQQSTFLSPFATMSVVSGGGSFSGSNYMAPSVSTPRVQLAGKLTSVGVTVTANRIISVQ